MQPSGVSIQYDQSKLSFTQIWNLEGGRTDVFWHATGVGVCNSPPPSLYQGCRDPG